MKTRTHQEKPALLYLMHIDWGWAKQRPHFVAENLCSDYSVTVCHKKNYRAATLSEAPPQSALKIERLFVLPFARFRIVAALNLLLLKLQLKGKVAAAKVIWVTHPVMYAHIRNELRPDTKLVYDCMDDILEFPDAKNSPDKLGVFRQLEADLVARSKVIFSSSKNLKTKLSERYACGDRVTVVNNAANFSGTTVADVPRDVEERLRTIAGKKVVYVGTISEWFDFDTVLDVLDRLSDVTFVLVGPCEVEIPRHDRLVALPPVEHKYVMGLLRLADAVIMPFRVTDLIKSVNPVKLYEYIASDKPAIAVAYDEVEAFGKYVYLYRSHDELHDLLARLQAGELLPKSDSATAREFVMTNTWSARAQQISSVLEDAV